jgi:hypothetical protein
MNRRIDTEVLSHLCLNGKSHKSWKLKAVYKLVQEHCANWRRDGTCEGAAIGLKTGRHYRWRVACGPCLLSADQRCPYFENWVLPMEKRGEKDWPTFVQGQAFLEAVKLYRSVFPETAPPPVETRLCPDCGKRSVEPRKRYCAECRNRRRKATKAQNNRNWRKLRDRRGTVKQNGSSPRAASQGASSNTRYPLPGEPVFGPLTVLSAANGAEGGQP